jgi:hypothetical protein
MNWKDELFQTDDRKAVVDFVTRHVRKTLYIEPCVSVEFNEEEFSVSAGTDRDEPVFSLFLTKQRQGAINLQYLNIAPDYKGNGWGSIVLKMALGIAYARGLDHLFIMPVKDDGFTYWPRMGALPYMREENTEQFGLQVMSWLALFETNCKDELVCAGGKHIEALRALAPRHPFKVWREMSQLYTRFGNGNQREKLCFVWSFFQGPQLLLPGELSTRKILQKRLGILPPFRDASVYFSHIIQDIRNSPSGVIHKGAALNAG